MITVKTNIGKAIEINITTLKNLSENDKMIRTIATSVLDLMKKRIHTNGKDAEGNQIGTYSKGYMVLRTGSFQNAGRNKKGKNIGKLKNAGVFTDKTIRLDKQTGVFSGEDKVGKARPRYNRGSDSKVILSLTRQMENDMKVVSLKNGSYGIGFSNKLNYDKSQWCEKTYKKEGKIYALSTEEIESIDLIVENFVKNAVS